MTSTPGPSPVLLLHGSAPQRASEYLSRSAPILPPRTAAEDVRVLVGDRAQRGQEMYASSAQRHSGGPTLTRRRPAPLHHRRPNPGARPHLTPARSAAASRSIPISTAVVPSLTRCPVRFDGRSQKFGPVRSDETFFQLIIGGSSVIMFEK